jgi:lipoyl(octanoyl) transferase
MPPATTHMNDPTPRVLQAYLLGRVDFDAALALQRRLVYETGGERSTGFLLLCEHPTGIAIGREGSVGHILLEPEEFRGRRWHIHRVNRGGGCLLHAPGQIAGYSILALDRARLNVRQYLDQLHAVLCEVLATLDVPATLRPGQAGVWAGDRRIAHVGVAVRDWVSYFGFALNVHPNLEYFRHIHCDGDPRPMTSIQRERRLPVRPATVRQRLLEAYAAAFAFERVALFHHHPSLSPKAPAYAVPSGSR